MWCMGFAYKTNKSHLVSFVSIFSTAMGFQMSPQIACVSNGSSVIVAKKWEPGNLVPSRFLGQIRKVEARLGKLAKIRKVETN